MSMCVAVNDSREGRVALEAAAQETACRTFPWWR